MKSYMGYISIWDNISANGYPLAFPLSFTIISFPEIDIYLMMQRVIIHLFTDTVLHHAATFRPAHELCVI